MIIEARQVTVGRYDYWVLWVDGVLRAFNPDYSYVENLAEEIRRRGQRAHGAHA